MNSLLVAMHPMDSVNRITVPFVACGDLSGYDADTTYPINVRLCCILLLFPLKKELKVHCM